MDCLVVAFAMVFIVFIDITIMVNSSIVAVIACMISVVVVGSFFILDMLIPTGFGLWDF